MEILYINIHLVQIAGFPETRTDSYLQFGLFFVRQEAIESKRKGRWAAMRDTAEMDASIDRFLLYFRSPSFDNGASDISFPYISRA